MALTEVDAARLNDNVFNTVGPFKNRIINGDMRIDQRNAGASASLTSSQTYFLDRWFAVEDTDGTMTIQQSTTAPTGFQRSALLTTGTADTSLGAAQYAYIAQKPEGFNVADFDWGTANAKTVTLSFWVRSSLTGTFGGAVSNSAYNRSYPFTYTISAANTFEYKSITIPGDTTGTWVTDNGIGMQIFWGLGVGSTNSGTAGSWAASGYISATGATSVIGTASATFYITGVQLEAGSVATPFERRSYGQELALCQRYAYVIRGQGTGSITPHGSAAQTTTVFVIIPFPVQMRAAPNFTLSGAAGNFTISDGNAGTDVSAVVLNDASPYSGRLNFTPVSGVTQFRPYMIETDNTNAVLIFSAEL